MDKAKAERILTECLSGPIYFSRTDLMYRKSHGHLLSGYEYSEFCKYKSARPEDLLKRTLPLHTFNSESIYFFQPFELTDTYFDYLKKLDIGDLSRIDVVSLLCSELDGTLQIEGINSTRRKIKEVIEGKADLKERNAQIIHNMFDGFMFVKGKPPFTKENLKRLYEKLSNECLENGSVLGEKLYRNDFVEVGGYAGCPNEDIEKAIDSLFAYVNTILSSSKQEYQADKLYLPFVCHYYILYIHPYFDYNGRTARMVYLWINFLLGHENIEPFFLSEAINDKKAEYYKAIEESRDSGNDLTYFLIFNFSLSLAYQQIYANCKNAKEKLVREKGIELTSTDLFNIRRIMSNSQNGFFTSKTFDSWTKRDVSRQLTHKDLSRLEKLGIIMSKSDGKTKVYKLNEDAMEFSVPSIKSY